MTYPAPIPLGVHAPIPLGVLETIASDVAAWPLVLVVANPGEGSIDVSAARLPSLRIAHVHADPTVAPAPYFTLLVEIDTGSGFATAYTTAGGFVAPWNGIGSGVSYHLPISPYVFTELTFEHVGGLPTDTTISVRVTGTTAIGGWGHYPWGRFPWGHVSGTSTALVVEYSFDTVDATAPRLVSAVATERETVRLTFDDVMRTETPDGRAHVATTTTEGAWGAISPGSLSLRVNGGATQTANLTADMLSADYTTTALALASVLPALFEGLSAVAEGDGSLSLYSIATGDAAGLQVTGGSLNAVLQFPTTAASGSDSSAASSENYTIHRRNVYPACAVHLTPQAVTSGDGGAGLVYDVAVQWPMTPGAPYEVEVAADVADSSGNAIASDGRTATFSGFAPPIPAGRVVKFPIPDDAFKDDSTEELRAFVNVLEEFWSLILFDIDALPDVWDSDRADADRLDLFLKDWGNPFVWADLDLSEAQRRRLLRALPDLYQYRGTDPGIEAAIRTLLEIECDVQSSMLEIWTLGVSLLGDYYPAQVMAANPETYNLSGADSDLWVAIDDGHPITAANPAGGTFRLRGRFASLYVAGYVWRVSGSTANDGTYTTTGSVETGDETVVSVAEAIPSATADGRAVQLVPFSSTPGVDFVDPALATADEVAVVIAAALYGGAAAALNPGGGTTVAIASSNPSGTVQVLGGSANTALGFDPTRYSATGGCVLGPGTPRLKNTFDLVVATMPSAADQALMRRIANWAKPVNKHLGRIRTAYVVEDDGIWRLGRGRLGADTVLG